MEKTYKMIEVYCTNLKESIDETTYQSLLSHVSKERVQKTIKMRFRDDRVRSLLAEALVQYYLKQKLNICKENISIVQNNFGKMYLKDIPNLFFNISHAKDWVICGWSDTEIGIDIELIDSHRIIIEDCFFSSKEMTYFDQCMPKEKIDLFYQLWTIKESYLKYIGTGFNRSPKSFTVHLDSPDIKIYSEQYENVKIYSLNFDEFYKLAVCCGDNETDCLKIYKLDVDQILDVLCIA